MYVSPNFKTKKQLKEAVAAGKDVIPYWPGPLGAGPVVRPFYGDMTFEQTGE